METKITVQGEGTYSLPVDTMSFQFELSVFDEDGKNLKSRKDKAFSDFLAGLEKLSLNEPPAYVATEIQKQYRRQDGLEIFLGYQMRDTYRLNLPLDLSLASSLFAFTGNAEATELTVSCSFLSSKKEEGEKAAMLLALKSATDKAERLAESLGKNIDDVLDIKVLNHGFSMLSMAKYSDAHVEDASFTAEVEALFLAK